VLVVAPWAIRNQIALGRPVLTTTHGGYTLLLANNPVFWREVVAGPNAVWEGRSLDAWQRSLERETAADGVPALDEIACDRWMRDRAVENIRREPGMFLRSAFYRLGRFWDIAPAAERLPGPVRWGVAAYYVATYVAAVVGIVCLWGMWRVGDNARAAPPPAGGGLGWVQGTKAGRGHPLTPAPSPQGKGGRGWQAVVLLVVAFSAVHAVYWTDARMRAPLVPAVAVLAAAGGAGLRRACGGRHLPP
jgi:hypothetical protein